MLLDQRVQRLQLKTNIIACYHKLHLELDHPHFKPLSLSLSALLVVKSSLSLALFYVQTSYQYVCIDLMATQATLPTWDVTTHPTSSLLTNDSCHQIRFQLNTAHSPRAPEGEDFY